MKVLVTGGSSLMGTGLARDLAARGDEVRCFQRHRVEALDDVAGVEQRLGDLTQPDDLDAAVAGCDAVVHLAAKVGIVGTRDEFVAVNVTGTRNLLDAARRAGIRRFVHVSSPSVAHDGSPIIGGLADTPKTSHPGAWYPETKAISENLALDANDAEMAVVVVRPHLVWGPGDTQLVGRIVERARAGRLALVGGGRALVDTTYIDNARSALCAALDAVEPGAVCAGRAYVIANGEPRPVRELVGGICRAAGAPFEPREVPLAAARAAGSLIERLWPRVRSGEEPPLTRFLADQLGTAHWFDPRPARDDLGWVPTVSIDDGLAELASWFEQQTRHGS
ncbi:NAD-dependent epimerase/dehydratase family protein [Ilumatobacter coccineus]|uniref:Putative steroid dehydrogenase n=1 Tax=Ilumatobacter coccineus (strain NBRC 103263 / KCTC 29153 / YM16-304) TaxID=1313172 RepID=A0A6C7E8M4_ILUCY|nr:NAD-dependent epimerase/dehydratase family protein [Ilumatobacter coccineus]BAN02703.1 putative steroid dehydrogenase [Ilumatobacter coccineus YM16-304]